MTETDMSKTTDNRAGDSYQAAGTWSGVQLLLMGFITLFLELALIRYLAGNVWNLGYFPNIVLLSVFVGMGIGFVFHHYFRERTSNALYHGALAVLAFLVVFVYFKHPVVPGFAFVPFLVGTARFFTQAFSAVQGV